MGHIDISLSSSRRSNYKNYYFLVSLLSLYLFGSLEVVATLDIVNPPQNTTNFVNETVVFPCELPDFPGESLQSLEHPANQTNVIWYRRIQYLGYLPVVDLESLKSRVETPADGSLIIKELHKDDTGFYECRIYNGIGERLSASAYLNVEFPATVIYAPPVQYQTTGRSGQITCEVHSNPVLEFVRWTKDNESLEPCQTEGFHTVKNGQILIIDRVNKDHQGNYTCTPYNIYGTDGASLIQVVVWDPPRFLVAPEPVYEGKVGASLEIPCAAATGSNIEWRKGNGVSLPRNRAQVSNGTLLLEDLHEVDYGEYACIASTGIDEVAAPTKIIVEGIKPRPPYNITASSTESSVTLKWEQADSVGEDARQSFVIRHRELGNATGWEEDFALPPGIKRFTITELIPGNTYEVQVTGINGLGEGLPSETISVTTKGPLKAYAPQNVTIADQSDSYAIGIRWKMQIDADPVADKIAYYKVQYRLGDSQSDGRTNLNLENIYPPQTSYTYLVRHLREETKYFFRVVAIPRTGSSAASEEVGHTLLSRDLQHTATSDCENKSVHLV